MQLPILVHADSKFYEIAVNCITPDAALSDLSGKILGCQCPSGQPHSCNGPAIITKFYATFPDAELDSQLYEKVFPPRKRAKKSTGPNYRTPKTHPQLKWPEDKGEIEFQTVWLDENGKGALTSAMAITAVTRLRTPLEAPVDPKTRVSHIDPAFYPVVFADWDPKRVVRLNDIALHDSKTLKEHERDQSFLDLIHCVDICYWIFHVTNEDIDRMGMADAWRFGMRSAAMKVMELTQRQPHRLFVDGNVRLPINIPGIRESDAEPKADSNYRLVAAASILGKVSRDRVVTLQADEAKAVHADYAVIFKDYKGYYGPKDTHPNLLKQGFVTRFHRTCFNPLRSLLEEVAEKSKS